MSISSCSNSSASLDQASWQKHREQYAAAQQAYSQTAMQQIAPSTDKVSPIGKTDPSRLLDIYV